MPLRPTRTLLPAPEAVQPSPGENVKRSQQFLRYVLMVVAGVGWLGVLGVAGAYVYLAPSLPTSAAMQHVEMNVPLRVYSRRSK